MAVSKSRAAQPEPKPTESLPPEAAHSRAASVDFGGSRLPRQIDDEAQKHNFQENFLVRIGGIAPFLNVFDSVVDGLFFLKDEASRLVWVSQRIWQRFGLHHGWQVAGTTDFDYFPKYVADNFIRDDQHVLKTAKPILRRVEIWFNPQCRLDWFVSTKFPVFDGSGRPIGIVGLIQNSASPDNAAADDDIGRVLKYIEANCRREIRIEELANAARLSRRQLLRRVRRELGLSVHGLVNRTRIQAASEALLRNDATIADVARDYGFSDQSAFTRRFHREMGLTPLSFLRKYGRRSEATDGD